jgi:hypothetical protein
MMRRTMMHKRQQTSAPTKTPIRYNGKGSDACSLEDWAGGGAAAVLPPLVVVVVVADAVAAAVVVVVVAIPVDPDPVVGAGGRAVV